MRSQKKVQSLPTPVRRQVLIIASRVMLVIAGLALVTAALMSARFLPGATGTPPLAPEAEAGEIVASVEIVPNPTPILLPTSPPTDPLPQTTPAELKGMRIGIVAGHSGYDPGAVCEDGLTEADVNLVVAREVVRQLAAKGYQVDLLDEYDERLNGYVADALVSVHADSCEVPGASGFKVARVTHSAIPEAEDRLVECLYQSYHTATGLAIHPNSITDDMTNYHAFMEIDALTPGAIIETGFLLEDREMLVSHQDLVAKGIVDGILCFLDQGQ